MTDEPIFEAPDGWEVRTGSLHRELSFADFDAAFAFMTRVAAEAARLDHHPDWSNSYDTVVIDLTSHDAGQITARDVSLAEAVNEVIEP